MRKFELSRIIPDINITRKNRPVFIGAEFEKQRYILSELLSNDFNNIDEFKKIGVELISPRRNFDSELVCSGYVMRHNLFNFGDSMRSQSLMLSEYGEELGKYLNANKNKYLTNNFEENSIVMYFSKKYLKNRYNHIGFINKKGNVVSKFDLRGAYEHPKEIVPYFDISGRYNYGPWIESYQFNMEIARDFWCNCMKKDREYLRG